jgi:hypothetical protein
MPSAPLIGGAQSRFSDGSIKAHPGAAVLAADGTKRMSGRFVALMNQPPWGVLGVSTCKNCKNAS